MWIWYQETPNVHRLLIKIAQVNSWKESTCTKSNHWSMIVLGKFHAGPNWCRATKPVDICRLMLGKKSLGQSETNILPCRKLSTFQCQQKSTFCLYPRLQTKSLNEMSLYHLKLFEKDTKTPLSTTVTNLSPHHGFWLKETTNVTLPKFNSSPLKMHGWKTSSFWVPVTFQGRSVSFREGRIPT